MPDRKPKHLPRYERAYNYFVRMETSGRSFRMRDVRRATQWEPSTIESYRTKKWSWFLVPADPPGYFTCHGLLAHSKEQFIDLHRQKRVPVVPAPTNVIEKTIEVSEIMYWPIKIDQRAWIILLAMLLIRVKWMIKG